VPQDQALSQKQAGYKEKENLLKRQMPDFPTRARNRINTPNLTRDCKGIRN
jgi:hypothetical protein